MHLYYFSDSYYPKINSGSILSVDLVSELSKNHTLSVFTLKNSPEEEDVTFGHNVNIYRIKTIYSRKNLFYRAFSEILIPLFFIKFLISKKLKKPDGIIFYSPTIFFGLVIFFLKIKFKKTKSYLVLRDIFPNWYYDINQKNKDVMYYFFKFFENFQYKVSDKIGVQSKSNLNYFKYSKFNYKVEVLHNWQKMREIIPNESVSLIFKNLKNKTIFIYAGNIGVSQQLENFFLAAKYIHDKKIGKNIFFIFIGDGYKKSFFKKFIVKYNLKNTLIYEQISNLYIPFLLNYCHAGIISLSLKHKLDNIPSKYISYTLSGLPVIALLNHGNDLVDLIKDSNSGLSVSSNKIKDLVDNILQLDQNIRLKKYNSNQIKKISSNLFSVKKAANLIISFFKND